MGAAAFEEHELGVSWLPDAEETMQRACHAVRLAGGVWIVDPVDVPGLDERIAAVGEPTGVLQLLDRHDRDGAAVAERLDVPLHRLPFKGVEGYDLEPVTLAKNRFWNEVAIWSAPERALIVPEAVGTAAYFCAGDEAVGIHPMLRLTPPTKLADYRPEHLLTGHGTGMHGGDTAAALADGIASSRGRIPKAIASIASSLRS